MLNWDHMLSYRLSLQELVQMVVVEEVLVLLLFERSLMGKILLFKAFLKYYQTTSHFHKLITREFYLLSQKSNMIFLPIVIFYLSNLTDFSVLIYSIPPVIFTIETVIINDLLIVNLFRSFTIIFIHFISFVVVVKLKLKMEKLLRLRTYFAIEIYLLNAFIFFCLPYYRKI